MLKDSKQRSLIYKVQSKGNKLTSSEKTVLKKQFLPLSVRAS